MPNYRYLIVDLITRQRVGFAAFTSVTFGKSKNGFAEFRASIPHSEMSDVLSPFRLVVVERDGQLVGDGILYVPRVVKQPGDPNPAVQFEGDSVASYFARRRLTETRTYEGVDEADVIADLIGWAQGDGSLLFGDTTGTPRGDIGVLTAVPPTGVSVDREYRGFERPSILEAINLVADVGASWRLDPVEAVDGTYPHRLRVTRTFDHVGVFEYGVNVSGYSFAEDGSAFASDVTAVGAGEGRDMRTATVSDVSAVVAGFPQVDEDVPYKDVDDDSLLGELAGEDLRLSRRPPYVIRLTLRQGYSPSFADFEIGDTVDVRISDGWVEVNDTMEIIDATVTVDREGNETVNVNVDTAEEGVES